jgi:hypothetical protein
MRKGNPSTGIRGEVSPFQGLAYFPGRPQGVALGFHIMPPWGRGMTVHRVASRLDASAATLNGPRLLGNDRARTCGTPDGLAGERVKSEK